MNSRKGTELQKTPTVWVIEYFSDISIIDIKLYWSRLGIKNNYNMSNMLSGLSKITSHSVHILIILLLIV